MNSFDPIELAVFKSATRSVAEEMGASLRRTAFSPNIKERRDYSCAVFDGHGQAIAMGDHMPVHLGSGQATSRFLMIPSRAGLICLTSRWSYRFFSATTPFHFFMWPLGRTMQTSAEDIQDRWDSAAKSQKKDCESRR